ncbi:MAG: hypothetical protein AAB588_05165 [Patescibacteria group bacterium]
MKIEPEDIKSFQRLWKEHFQLELSDEEAGEKATHLLEMMKVLYRPIPKPKPDATSQPSILDLNKGNPCSTTYQKLDAKPPTPHRK